MQEFFIPVDKAVLTQGNQSDSTRIGNQLKIYSKTHDFPSLEDCKMVLFGIKETRNSTHVTPNSPNFDSVRKALYSLYVGNWQHSLADLGDIQAGATIEDTYFAVKTIVSELLSKNIIPLILGGSQDLVYPIYRAFDGFHKMINFVNIDSKFDIGNAETPISNTSYVGKMVVDKPYNLFNYCNIGYQSYYNAADEIQLLEKLYFEAFRLGEIVKDIHLVEPLTRDADIISLDLAAIKGLELSYINNNAPNGFNSREICAIARYAGISNRVRVFGIFEITNFENSKQASMLLAQILWYFIEGVNFRLDDGNMHSEIDYKMYRVPVENEVLLFKKSLKTQRWWIEIPFISEENNKLKRYSLLPCSYSDYEDACNQEIPERWLKAKRKNEI